ncbi:MAG: hypothetical protein R3B96_14625 [Pirellulaceae bacterium]
MQVWHPVFEFLPEDGQWQIVFLLFDEALGKFGTETWIGDIEVAAFEKDDKTRSITDLPRFIDQVSEYLAGRRSIPWPRTRFTKCPSNPSHYEATR